MSKLLALIVLLSVLVVSLSGCKSHSGSREYIPGQGWKHND